MKAEKIIMKKISYLILGLNMMVLIGCAVTSENSRYEFKKPDTFVKNKTGFLQVFTCKAKEKSDYPDDPVYDVFKGYTIYGKTGDFVRNVEKSYKNPPIVRLNEGEYIIVAELHKNIINSFLVKIEEGKGLEIDSNSIENPLASN